MSIMDSVREPPMIRLLLLLMSDPEWRLRLTAEVADEELDEKSPEGICTWRGEAVIVIPGKAIPAN